MMKKRIDKRTGKKIGMFTALAALVVGGTVGTSVLLTSANFTQKDKVIMNAENAELKAEIYMGTANSEATIVNGLTTVDGVTVSTLGAATYEYESTPLSLDETGETAVLTDDDRFLKFAPGQLRCVSYKVVNTGNVPINLSLSQLAAHVVTSATDCTWDEANPLGAMENIFWYKSENGAWTSIAASKLMSAYEAAEASVTSDPISIPVGESLQLVEFVEFVDDQTPHANNAGDNVYMNSKWNFTLTFMSEQPATANSTQP